VSVDALGSRAPYPGLRAFRREESDLFFGREDCVSALVDRLRDTHFLAVLGSSGTGKSSVVKTGLLDSLELGLMAKAGSSWRIADFRPGSEPLRNLAAALLAGEPHATTPTELDLLRGFLARGPRAVIEWCRDGNLPEGTNLLLLVDQFEELFRYQDYARREETTALVELLLESARSSEFPIYVTITMRSEYLGACALIEGLSEAISRGMVLVPRMTREQCRAAIVGPAEVCGIKTDVPLLNELLNDLASFAAWDDGGGDEIDRLVRRADQLPLLQYTLNRMWLQARERRGKTDGSPLVLRLSDYEAIGRLRGALNAHADQLLKSLVDKGLGGVTEIIFRSLVSGSTVAEAVRRPRRFGELVTLAGGNRQAVREVVDTFRAAGCNFLTPEFDPAHPKPLDDDAIIDISHESLIRQWITLSHWLEKEARAAQHWRRLRDRMADGDLLQGRELGVLIAWKEEMKPNAEWAKRYGGDFPAAMKFLEASQSAERKRRRRTTLIPVATGVAVIIAVAATSFVFYAERQASALQRALADAETARREAESAKEAEEKKNSELQKALADAEAARREAEAARKTMEEKAKELADALAQMQAANDQYLQLVKKTGGLGAPPLKGVNYADESTAFEGVQPSTELVKNVDGPTPTTIPGGKVLTTLQLYEGLARGTLGKDPSTPTPPVMVDAWSDPHHMTIPTSTLIPEAGKVTDSKPDKAREQLWTALNKASGGNFEKPLVFFSSGVKNWEGYNAALRAIDMGYSRVYWYRGGIASWKAAGQPLVNP